MRSVEYGWMILCMTGLVALPVIAQQAPPADRYEQRVADLRGELLAVSQDIDEGVDRILSLIIPLADSKDTGNKVTQLKQSTIESLRKVIDYYASERQKLEGDLARSTAALTKPQMAGQVEVIDEKIDQRIDDILRISESLARNQEIEKYDTWYDYEHDDIDQVINDDYRQNLKVQRRVVDTRGGLADSLKQSIASLNARLSRYERTLGYQTTPENTEAIQSLINDTKARITERENQLASLGDLSGEEGLKTIGKADLKVINQIVNEQKTEIRASFDLMRRLKGEYDNALIRMNNARRMAE